MGKPILTYFPFGGRAEATRIAFFYGDVDFEDKRITFQEFGVQKAEGKFPLGSLPVLEVDGKLAAQSVACCRYAGKLGKTYPTNEADALFVDMIMETLEECLSKLPFGGDDLKEKREKFATDCLPKFMTPLNKIAADNSANGFMVGNSLSTADIMVYTNVRFMASGNLDHLDKDYIQKNQPALFAVYEKVAALDKIKAFNAKFNPPKDA